ncbi:hypothetical protein MP638_006026 [Amoeboaphelidium occidentale]|nr:hypothetical protein MP638_006026 [Amoeboaphelidium occidentale]
MSSDFSFKLLEGFSKVTRWARDQIEEAANQLPQGVLNRQASEGDIIDPMGKSYTSSSGDSTEWEDLLKDPYFKRWADSVFQDADDRMYEKQQKERVMKGGVYLLMDEDLIREMETQLGSFELVSVVDSSEGDSFGDGEVTSDQNPVTLEEFEGLLRQENYSLENIAEDIVKRGIDKESRKEIWPYFLGLYPFQRITYDKDQKDKFENQLKQEYEYLVRRWKHNEDILLKIPLEDRKHRIEKDVVRTDSSCSFYSECSATDAEVDEMERLDHGSIVAIQKQMEIFPRWRALRDLLMAYSVFHVSLGYVQGMSDIASPILASICPEPENDYKAFWIFSHFLIPFVPRLPAGSQLFEWPNEALPLAKNFHIDQSGMKTRLIMITYLLRILEPAFYEKLRQMDSGENKVPGSGATSLFWLFKSLLLVFKRDVPEDDDFSSILRLWDAIVVGRWCWSAWMDVWIAVAIVHLYVRPHVQAGAVDTFEGLLKLMQFVSGSIDVLASIKCAKTLMNRFKSVMEPPSIKLSLGLEIPSSDAYANEVWRPLGVLTKDLKDALTEDLSSTSNRRKAARARDPRISVDEAIVMLSTTIVENQVN